MSLAKASSDLSHNAQHEVCHKAWSYVLQLYHHRVPVCGASADIRPGFIPFLGYHHILMILIAIAIILLSLLLAGCSSSSPLIPDIFLISLYYKSYPPVFDPAQVDPGVTTAIANIVGQAQLEVRVGYFGICINPDGGAFLCSNNASSLAGQVSVDQDPLNLIWVASTFKDSIVFPYLM